MAWEHFLVLAVASALAVNVLVKFFVARRIGSDQMAEDKDKRLLPREVSVRSVQGIWSNCLLLLVLVRQMIENLIGKVFLYIAAALHMLLSNELGGMSTRLKDASSRIDIRDAVSVRTKTLVFVRHAESVWNYAFNRGFGLGFPFRMGTFWAWETFLTCEPDSVLFDSPLSTHGIAQSFNLRQWVVETESSPTPPQEAGGADDGKLNVAKEIEATAKILRGDSEKPSVTICSNLRRAISTTFISLGDRLNKNQQEKVYIHSALQEATRNPDGLSLSLRRRMQAAPQFEKGLTALRLEELYANRGDPQFNDGNKGIFATLDARFTTFAQFVFSQPFAEGKEFENLVVCGHSGWFRNFFRRFLPHEAKHQARDRKIANCGVVKFELSELKDARGRTDYRIDPEGIVVAYGGFK